VSDAGAVAAALLAGVRFAFAYNPLTATVSASIAAALAGTPRVHAERSRWGVPVLAGGWLLGDGLRVLGRARDAFDGLGTTGTGSGPVWTVWVVLGVWAIGSLLVGYVVPTLAGATVGRRVTHGTGWLAAAAVALTLALTLSVIGSALG
jgi:hypothetical protein